MKKIISVLLMLVVISISLCGCGAKQATVSIKLKDGTSKTMSISELYSWKQEYTGRAASEFQDMIKEATVSGSGKVVSVTVEEPFSKSGSTRRGNRFPCKIELDNGITLDITIKYGSNGFGYDNPDYNFPGDIPSIDIFEGDMLSFKGTIYSDCIDAKDSLEIRITSEEVGEFEKTVGLEYLPTITLQ